MGTPCCIALCAYLVKLVINEFQGLLGQVFINFSQYPITSFSCLTIIGYRPVSPSTAKLDGCNLTPCARFKYDKCSDSKRLFGFSIYAFNRKANLGEHLSINISEYSSFWKHVNVDTMLFLRPKFHKTLKFWIDFAGYIFTFIKQIQKDKAVFIICLGK